MELLLIYRPHRDGRLSWPSWLTHSGQSATQSVHLSIIDRAQGREKTDVRKIYVCGRVTNRGHLPGDR